MSAIERNVRQRRDEAGISVSLDHETAQEVLYACVENVDDNKFRRVASDRAARAKKCEEGGSGSRVKRQSVAQAMDKTIPFDVIEIHSPLHQLVKNSAAKTGTYLSRKELGFT